MQYPKNVDSMLPSGSDWCSVVMALTLCSLLLLAEKLTVSTGGGVVAVRGLMLLTIRWSISAMFPPNYGLWFQRLKLHNDV